MNHIRRGGSPRRAVRTMGAGTLEFMVASAVCEEVDLSIHELLSAGRSEDGRVRRARWIVYYLLHVYGDRSLREIGQLFCQGYKTVEYGIRRVRHFVIKWGRLEAKGLLRQQGEQNARDRGRSVADQ